MDVKLQIVPVTRASVQKFIAKHHRHNAPSVQAIFRIGIALNGELVGVAEVGIPKARLLMDGKTLEVTRTCVVDGIKNGNSMLYGACARAAKELGWSRLITYTLPTESGISLKASGWKLDEGLFGGQEWASRYDRFEQDIFGNKKTPQGKKHRWHKVLNGCINVAGTTARS